MEDFDDFNASDDIAAKIKAQIAETKESIHYDLAIVKNDIVKLKKARANVEKAVYADATKKDEDIKNKSEEIYKAEAKLRDLKIQLKSLDDNNVSEAREEEEARVKHALSLLSKLMAENDSLGYSIADKQYVYVDDYHTKNNCINVAINLAEPSQFIPWLAGKLGVDQWYLPAIQVLQTFINEKKAYDKIRYTVNPVMWDDRIYKPLNYLRKYFIDTVDVSTLEYSDNDKADTIKHFNWLMYSLSGAKAENQNYIEKFILHKVINYTDPVSTPDLIIVGHVGGNGKGILQGIIRQMFPSSLSGKANSKTINGNFNSIMLGKLIVFFDDQKDGEIPLEKVKELAGSDTMIYEPKGKDQYEGEKTHSSAWFANKLPFKLTPGGGGGGVDRRFSITMTDITFLKSIKHHLNLDGIQDVKDEDCKEIAEVIVKDTFQNREKIAIWFDYLRKKHPEVVPGSTLQVLHGEDYKYFLDMQKTVLSQIFDSLILPILNNNGCIPMEVIKDLVRIFEDKTPPSHKKLLEDMQEIAHIYSMNLETSQSQIQIINESGNKDKWRTIVLHKKDLNFNKQFDWGLVSTAPFRSSKAKDEFLLDSESLAISIKTDKSVDIDEDDRPQSSAKDVLKFLSKRK